jgi:ubiquinone/menaquinone biosynthesis C-methylase UbiE
MSTTTAPADFTAIKAKQQGTWSAGDYAVIGTTLQLTGELLCESVDVHAGDRVLDVAAGNGNASLAAARRGCDVTATDYVPALLEGTRSRAEAERMTIAVQEADAEALPFPDASYDVVLSAFGVMFTPDQERAAAELARVTRPGGHIGLTNWTPTGFIGQMFKVVGKHVPPPAGINSPLQWGTEERLAELFGDTISTIRVERREFVFRYRSPEHWLDTFRTFYGPTHKAFGALDQTGQDAFAAELLDLARAGNTSSTGGLRVPSEYLEVVAVRAG